MKTAYLIEMGRYEDSDFEIKYFNNNGECVEYINKMNEKRNYPYMEGRYKAYNLTNLIIDEKEIDDAYCECIEACDCNRKYVIFDDWSIFHD